MKLPALLTAAGLLALAAVGHSQAPPTPPAPTPADPAQYVPPGAPRPEVTPPSPAPLPPDATGPNIPPPSVYQPIPMPTPAVPPPSSESTVEQVIDALEKIKAQKAELEKKEQALLETLNKKLAKQAERLKSVGWKKDAAPVGGPFQTPDTVRSTGPAVEPAPLVNTPPKQR